MSIPDIKAWDKQEQGGGGLKAGFRKISGDWVLWAVLVLTASLCFGLGLIAARENPKQGDSLWIEQLPAVEQGIASTSPESVKEEVSPLGGGPAAAVSAVQGKGTFVASKSGSKYYLPSCSGAKRIKDENKVWFKTKQEAESAGYEAATTCKGM